MPVLVDGGELVVWAGKKRVPPESKSPTTVSYATMACASSLTCGLCMLFGQECSAHSDYRIQPRLHYPLYFLCRTESRISSTLSGIFPKGFDTVCWDNRIKYIGTV